MGVAGRSWTWIRRMVLIVLGWTLVVVGVAALVLPGPGLLTLAAGLIILSQEYEWAARRVEPVKAKALEAAAAGVQSWPRILASLFGVAWLIGWGIVWAIEPTVPVWWVFGPQLPFAGWGVAFSLILSGLVAFALLAYSFRRFGGSQPAPSSDVAVRGRTESR